MRISPQRQTKKIVALTHSYNTPKQPILQQKIIIKIYLSENKEVNLLTQLNR